MLRRRCASKCISSFRVDAAVGIPGGLVTPFFCSIRHKSIRDLSPTDETALAHKPVDIRVAEMKESRVYTLQEYLVKDDAEEKAKASLSGKIEAMHTNPMWILWALGFVALSCYTVVVSIRIRREQLRFDPKLRAVKQVDSPTGPSIGGPFSLVDTNGKQWTDKDFHGKWIYIYFGFTNCPDICPDEMAKMSRVINHLDKKVGKDFWQPIFITLDPKRDSAAKIKEYLQDFHPRILGLSGTLEEVESAARQYRVYFAIPDEQAMSQSDYLVDHSIIMYLMDPEGKFCDYTTKEFTWYESYSKLLRRMMDRERQREKDGLESNKAVANVASMMSEGTEPPQLTAPKQQNSQQQSFRR